MRAITTAQEGVISTRSRYEDIRVQVKDAAGSFQNLRTYLGFQAVKSASWSDSTENPNATARVVLTLGIEDNTPNPLMVDAPANHAWLPTNAYSALIALNREIRIDVAIVPEEIGTGGSDFMEVFRGHIDSWTIEGDSMTLECRDLSGTLMDYFLPCEWALAYGDVGGTPVAMRIFELGQTYALNEYVLPTDAKLNGYFYKVTTAGTVSTSVEPVWPTSAGTIASGSAVFTYQAATNTTGYSVQTVIQSLLTASLAYAGMSAVTLYTPVSPSFTIKPYKQDRQPLGEAIRTLALLFGGDVRYKWRSGTTQFELTLFTPDRTGATVSRTFGPDEYLAISSLKTDSMNIRNVCRVIYSDITDLDASNHPKRKSQTYTDSASVTAYGYRYMEISEANTSAIDTSAEALAMATACIKDLATPVVEQEIEIRGFPWAECTDQYTFEANAYHYSADQTLAVYQVEHTAEEGAIKTVLSCRGKPSLAPKRWLRVEAGRTDKPRQFTALSSTSPSVIAAVSQIGGAKITIAPTTPAKISNPPAYEYHIGTSSGFTTSSSTLVNVSKSTVFQAANLLPGGTYYAKVVPVSQNSDGSMIPMLPSLSTSFVAGQAKAQHLDPAVSLALLPLNGSFEHATGDITTTPPDQWAVSGSTWGTDVYYVDTGANYGRAIEILGTANKGTLVSSIFEVAGGSSYSLDSIIKTSGAAAGTVSYNVVVKFYIDSALAPSGTLPSSTFSFGTGVTGSWIPCTARRQSVPSDSNYATVTIEKSAATANVVIDVGYVRLTRVDAQQESPTTATLQNSWVTFGAPGRDPSYWKDTLGHIHLAGRAKSGTTTAGTTIFTLPSGYRPGYTLRFPSNDNGAFAMVEVDSSGNVKIRVGGNTDLSFDGISFTTI